MRRKDVYKRQDQSYEARKKALEEGPYGKCVFHNDNDVVDHQVASLLFENGTTVAVSYTHLACGRSPITL